MTSMTFTARQSTDPGKTKTQCAVVPVFGKSLSAAAKAYDKLSDGSVSATLALGDFNGKAGQSCMLAGTGGAKRLLLVGCGEQKSLTSQRLVM